MTIAAGELNNRRNAWNDRVSRKQVAIHSDAYAASRMTGGLNEFEPKTFPNQSGANLFTRDVRRLAININADGVPRQVLLRIGNTLRALFRSEHLGIKQPSESAHSRYMVKVLVGEHDEQLRNAPLGQLFRNLARVQIRRVDNHSGAAVGRLHDVRVRHAMIILDFRDSERRVRHNLRVFN